MALRQQAQPKRAIQAEDNQLVVINDLANGKEYYISVIDAFEFRGKDYCVMYHYRPEVSRKEEPEIILMRSYKGSDGSRYFCSIRSKKELALVFELFYQRYWDARNQRSE